ncbi:MAG TPA: phosphoenolpyruvate--protein phosphotransferase, partial [Kofleriaceae bacterium]|nr:phosphoenolpyruvate--protein phosphotransferase [Kofleriaceae bacterium]
MTPLVLVAPLAGRVVLLDDVPDPAFAQGMVGDGVAIDPSRAAGELRAPCDGTVVSVHRARHACTLRTDDGAEILLHIGIDTVALRGDGFRALVRDGQRVRTGEPLIRFDRDAVSRRVPSLLTPVVLVGGDGLAVLERTVGREVAAGTFLMAIGPAGARPAVGDGAAGDASTATRCARLTLRNGLHARPAAVLVQRAQQHAGAVTVASGPRSANAKSLSALLALDVRPGDQLAITATGPGAEASAADLAALIAAGLGETPDPGAGSATPAPRAANGLRDSAESSPPHAPAAWSASPTDSAPWAANRYADSAESPARASVAHAGSAALPRFEPGTEVVLEGIAGAAGLAVGRAIRLPALLDAGTLDAPRDGAGAEIERARLAEAIAAIRGELEQTVAGARARSDRETAEIFGAHLALLSDPELAAAADRAIAAGRSAASAWRAALGELAAVLRGLGNPLLAERTADLADLERRTLAQLSGQRGRVPAELPDGAVVVADELLPSELAAAAGRIAGLCVARGGATSHVAILAAGLGVPAVVGLGDAALRVPDGAPVIVDGDRGRIRVFPAAATREATARAIVSRTARRGAARAAAHQPAVTADGAEIAVCANLGAPGDAGAALDAGADGCGLLRTEFLFLGRPDAPGEDEQAACYQTIADRLNGRPLVIRTLDAGGDKPLGYLAQPREDNPALGLRGVRLALRHPAILRTQLRAVLRVRPAGVCRIMVPMIATLAELRAVRALLDAERAATGAPPIALGAMIELPAAALAAGALARDAEFFSIGTNDLAQYALAIDRGNPAIAAGLDPLHPGVLQLIASTASAARRLRRPVAVCGGAAADPCAVPIPLALAGALRRGRRRGARARRRRRRACPRREHLARSVRPPRLTYTENRMVTVTQKSFAGLQKLGRALMLPIAVMPLAALLLRLGQDDLL